MLVSTRAQDLIPVPFLRLGVTLGYFNISESGDRVVRVCTGVEIVVSQNKVEDNCSAA